MGEDIRRDIILLICEFSNTTSLSIIQICLDCFDEMNKFSYLQTQCIGSFVASLCRIVNIEKFSNISCRIIMNAIQNCGYIGIQSLCLILEDPISKTTNLLRGAIFFLGFYQNF